MTSHTLVYDVTQTCLWRHTGDGHDAEGGVRLPEAQVRGQGVHTEGQRWHLAGEEERPEQPDQAGGGEIDRKIQSRLVKLV